MKIVISSGHGLHVPGASGYLDEVTCAREIVDQVAVYLRRAGVDTIVFHDNTSHSVDENLDTIVSFHNNQGPHDYDVSVHLNAFEATSKCMGTEVIYVTQSTLAANISEAIADAADLPNRGGKYDERGLAFLWNTNAPAVLVEVLFVDSRCDAQHYSDRFDEICGALAAALSGQPISPGEPGRPERPPIEPPQQPGEDHPTIGQGDQGPAVAEAQHILGLPEDGEFGPVTSAGVTQFQRAAGLDADGVVGPNTWAALDDLDAKMERGDDGIDDRLANKIDILCANSPVNDIDWDDRGLLPAGFYAGMAKTYALVLTSEEGAVFDAIEIMSKPSRGDTAHDALALYEDEFEDMDIDVREGGITTLRALFIMMVGLAARESSGDHWCGRDLTADTGTAEEAEAGFAQTSWNIRNFSPLIPPLLPLYWDDPNGFRPTFERGCPPPSSDDLNSYGTGDGARYQFLAKYSPAFHALVTGVGMRLACTHWGPIKYGEIDLAEAVRELLLQIEQLVEDQAVALPF
jgi:peptidoglycan hydrolase-like protein with peptidoglycan-binding domain